MNLIQEFFEHVHSLLYIPYNFANHALNFAMYACIAADSEGKEAAPVLIEPSDEPEEAAPASEVASEEAAEESAASDDEEPPIPSILPMSPPEDEAEPDEEAADEASVSASDEPADESAGADDEEPSIPSMLPMSLSEDAADEPADGSSAELEFAAGADTPMTFKLAVVEGTKVFETTIGPWRPLTSSERPEGASLLMEFSVCHS
jgi:hypothetical protein